MSLPALENNMLVPGFLDAIDISKERAAVKNSVDSSAGPGGQAAIGSFMLAVSNILKTGTATTKVQAFNMGTTPKGTLLAIDTQWNAAEGAVHVFPADQVNLFEAAMWVAHEDIPEGGFLDVTSGTILVSVAQDLSETAVGAVLFTGVGGALLATPPTTGHVQIAGFLQSPGTGNGDAVVAFCIQPSFTFIIAP